MCESVTKVSTPVVPFIMLQERNFLYVESAVIQNFLEVIYVIQA
jgi:hypothetical protein